MRTTCRGSNNLRDGWNFIRGSLTGYRVHAQLPYGRHGQSSWNNEVFGEYELTFRWVCYSASIKINMRFQFFDLWCLGSAAE